MNVCVCLELIHTHVCLGSKLEAEAPSSHCSESAPSSSTSS